MRSRSAPLLSWILILLLAAGTGAVLAQEAPAADAAEGSDTADSPDQPQTKIEDIIVVTASRTEQRLQEAPAAMTVIDSETLETAPADNYGDLLRNVPGLNVSQISARDIQITGRSATNSLAASQLVLLDGRTLYLDFFGFVMWDFLPVNPREVKQIEVVRGPGSAVWGANAMTGVINLVTKRPSEMVGTSLLLGAGEVGTAFGSLTHAGVNGRVGYKLSASYYEQDPYDRPTGIIPGSPPPGTPYPPFENQGTSQPKVDLRVDVDREEAGLWSFSTGYAGTDGIIHSGIGPFDIDSGSSLSYAKADWSRRALKVTLFANILDGQAQNLLTRGTGGQPLLLGFDSETYNLDVSNTSILGERHVLTYGANARHNSFDLSIAPEGDSRDELGAFLQDEILLTDRVSWLVGARWDDIDPIGRVVSPRTSLLISPTPDHTFRVSFNRAFRAPSLIQNYLDITIVNEVTFPAGPPFGLPVPVTYMFPTFARGNPELQEEQLDAYEVGYVGNFAGNTTVSLSVYRNETTDSTDFFPATFYTSGNPPPGWPLPPFVLDLLLASGSPLPESFSYRNIGEVVDEGLELAFTGRPGRRWSWNANYSYQADPEVTGIDESEINTPPKNRFNVGAAYDGGGFFVNGNVNYQDEARWTDVLDARFHGVTDSFTSFNLSLGVRLMDERLTLSLVGTNLFDEKIQQHVFGDIISRKVVGQVRIDL